MGSEMCIRDSIYGVGFKPGRNYTKFNLGNISYFNSGAAGIHIYDAYSGLYEYGTRKI